jgi:hypothetical protein
VESEKAKEIESGSRLAVARGGWVGMALNAG